MLQSMTAFARNQQQSAWGNLICEVRSINHRYLDISIYVSDVFRAMEMPIRECIQKFVKRGKIECSIRYQASLAPMAEKVVVNTAFAKELCEASEKISNLLKNAAPVNATDILRYPGVIVNEEKDLSQLKSDILQLLEKTMKELVAMREREAEELKQLFLKRLNAIRSELDKVRVRLPYVLEEQKQRINNRFAEATIDLDPNRLEQEMLMFVQKIDIAEEVDRTETHVAEMHRVLKEGGLVGRRLDFLLQELNREANTMGSKSVDSEVTHAAVEMKVLIEQIREQVQNIE